MKLRTRLLALAAVAALGAAAGNAMAAATLINTAGTVALGVNDLGHLNTTVGSVAVNAGGNTGLAYKFADGSFRDATAPGCLCEGWGVSVNGTTSGWASADFFNSGGISGLSSTSFASTATTATSVVALTALSGVSVTHSFAESTAAPGVLFKVTVTITNGTANALTDVKYVRAMDWDVPLTEFNEYVTIKGTGTTTLLEASNDNGFCNVNPLASCSPILGGTTNQDFTDSGPFDHGAYFRFNFGTIAAGESYSFDIFYGAAADETSALAAITAADIELYSLGQSNSGTGPANDAPTFIFGFSGVGGVPVGTLSAPDSLALAGLALMAMGAVRRRGQQA